MKKILLLTTCLLGGLMAAYNPDADIYADANKAYRASQEYAAVLQGSERIVSDLLKTLCSLKRTAMGEFSEILEKALHDPRQELAEIESTRANLDKALKENAVLCREARISLPTRKEAELNAVLTPMRDELAKRYAAVQQKVSADPEYTELSAQIAKANSDLDAVKAKFENLSKRYPSGTYDFRTIYEELDFYNHRAQSLDRQQQQLMDDALGNLPQAIHETEQAILQKYRELGRSEEGDFYRAQHDLSQRIKEAAAQKEALEQHMRKIEMEIVGHIEDRTDNLHHSIVAATPSLRRAMVQGTDVDVITTPIAAAIAKAFAR